MNEDLSPKTMESRREKWRHRRIPLFSMDISVAEKRTSRGEGFEGTLGLTSRGNEGLPVDVTKVNGPGSAVNGSLADIRARHRANLHPRIVSDRQCATGMFRSEVIRWIRRIHGEFRRAEVCHRYVKYREDPRVWRRLNSREMDESMKRRERERDDRAQYAWKIG